MNDKTKNGYKVVYVAHDGSLVSSSPAAMEMDVVVTYVAGSWSCRPVYNGCLYGPLCVFESFDDAVQAYGGGGWCQRLWSANLAV